MQKQAQFTINEKNIRRISVSIADEVAEKIYQEFLLMKYLPEVMKIKKGELKAMDSKETKNYIKQRIKSLK